MQLRNLKWCSVSSLTFIEYSSDQQRLWSDWAYAQADLRPCWSHIPHCWKSRVTAQMCLAQGHNAVAQVRLEPPDTRSRVKHSTTTVNLNLSILKISYEGCSNMNASSFITFFTYMLRQNVIPFWKELFLAFQMAPNIKKHTLFFSRYRPLYKGRSSILKFFWIKLQHTFCYLCGYSVISLLIWDKMTPNFSCKFK